MRKVKAQPENTVDTILRAGQIVDGKYRVDRLLGQGGMAAVWAGTNERSGKRVALKVILPSLVTTPEAQQLLHSEALAASRVNHPNVVTVFDVIEHEGMTCIVMELLEGEPLGSYIARNGYLSVGEATGILLPAMRGVAAAHAQGVIHRDLKPQNIFICVGPDGRIVTSKVLDFGISVMVERAMDPSAGPAPGLALGTPAYMSPEHISGAAPIDQRADVYGFGVLLYEALTGQMPFPGEQGPALFERILNQPAPAVTLFRPDLPPGLVRIIDRAMAKQPDQRYPGLNSMVGAIEDELAPATPPPRVLTPLAGVPSLALLEPASGPHAGPAVPAIVKPEPSGQHQETQILFGFPLEKESKEAVSNHETQMLFGFPLEKQDKKSVPDGATNAGGNEGPPEASVPDGKVVSNGVLDGGVTEQITESHHGAVASNTCTPQGTSWACAAFSSSWLARAGGRGKRGLAGSRGVDGHAGCQTGKNACATAGHTCTGAGRSRAGTSGNSHPAFQRSYCAAGQRAGRARASRDRRLRGGTSTSSSLATATGTENTGNRQDRQAPQPCARRARSGHSQPLTRGGEGTLERHSSSAAVARCCQGGCARKHAATSTTSPHGREAPGAACW